MDSTKALHEAHAAVNVVIAKLKGEPTKSREWLIIGLQLRAAARAANKVADALRKEEKEEQHAARRSTKDA